MNRAFAVRALGAALVLGTPVHAATLEVGPSKPYPALSAAVAHASDGDTILIAPGTYYDCAVVGQSNLTIAGAGPGVVLTDKTCEGKALLVLHRGGTTVRDLHLARARVEDGNGAGIRLEAPGLTLERVAFDDDEVGLLSGATGGAIRVQDCVFTGGGVGGEQPLFAIMAGRAGSLSVRSSRFDGVAGGQIATEADHSEIVGNTIATGTGDLPAAAIEATSGSLLITDNRFLVGPHTPRRGAAVSFWDNADGALRHNTLVNQTGQPVALLLDWSWNSPTLEDNAIPAGDALVTSHGILRHRVYGVVQAAKLALHRVAHDLKALILWLV